MSQDPLEWQRQADYDMDTADYMYSGGRCIHAVFMCHLAIEKALKEIYQKQLEGVGCIPHLYKQNLTEYI